MIALIPLLDFLKAYKCKKKRINFFLSPKNLIRHSRVVKGLYIDYLKNRLIVFKFTKVFLTQIC